MNRPKPKRLPLHLDLVQIDTLLLLLEILLESDNDLVRLENLETLSHQQLQTLEMVKRKVAFISRLEHLPKKGGAK